MAVSEQELIDAATTVREQAYAPFSGYRVGAAIVDEAGRVHVGCNVENSAFPSGTCAEAGAIAAMIAAGGRRIVAVAAVGGRERLEACTPCGNCRQQIGEFADDATRVVLLDDDGGTVICSMQDLLPGPFRLPGNRGQPA